MGFETQITVTGPWRSPAQMLAEQEVAGHTSVHDEGTASSLGLSGAPIEGPTHFSQFDPIGVALWGTSWFERGCISSHFRTMVVEGEQVQATATIERTGADSARIAAQKEDGTPVLAGTMSVGPDHPSPSSRLAVPRRAIPALYVIDQLEVGMSTEGPDVSMSHEERNGKLYPFSLAEKVDRITEPHPWYTPDGGASSPWGRAIVPMEMISVLAHKSGQNWPVRQPSFGLFLDLQIKLVNGPVFVDQTYATRREVIGLSQSKRTESYWTLTTLTDTTTGLVAPVLLHSGVFKESYAGYPTSPS
ncbi:MAG: hypothetical protein R2715_22085 [Ilumatobacteraceae bacterium]